MIEDSFSNLHEASCFAHEGERFGKSLSLESERDGVFANGYTLGVWSGDIRWPVATGAAHNFVEREGPRENGGSGW